MNQVRCNWCVPIVLLSILYNVCAYHSPVGHYITVTIVYQVQLKNENGGIGIILANFCNLTNETTVVYGEVRVQASELKNEKQSQPTDISTIGETTWIYCSIFPVAVVQGAGQGLKLRAKIMVKSSLGLQHSF